MSIGGYGQGGTSSVGPSRAYVSLPYKGYRELDPWFEEFVDAWAIELDILNAEFINAQARANLLDPTYTPTLAASKNAASTVQAPLSSVNQDSMLDILTFIALNQYPIDKNFSVADRQALIAAVPPLAQRKGVRLWLLNLISKVTGGVVYGWTTPPYNFSVIVPDGAPSPGLGAWSPVIALQVGTVTATNGSAAVVGVGTAFTSNWVGYKISIGVNQYWVLSVTDATHLTLSANAVANASAVPFYVAPGGNARPWLFQALKNVVGRYFPDWANFGIGYSQFRVGYSASGEPVFPTSCTLNLFSNEHFLTWSAGAPSSYSSSTTTQNSNNVNINREFTGSCCQFDMTAQSAGTIGTVSQSGNVNNQLTHRVEVDYQYTNPQSAAVLYVTVSDNNAGGLVYWTGSVWQTAIYRMPLPVSATRTRYAVDVIPQPASTTASITGTAALTVAVTVVCDGTATTQQVHTIYRMGLYEKFNLAAEQLAGGERTLWQPLHDQFSRAIYVRTGTNPVVEINNAARTSMKLWATTNTGIFPYHPAISGRSFRANSAWTNLVKGSLIIGADWTPTNCTATGLTISPIVAETVGTAEYYTASATGANVTQASIVANPSSKSYLAGIWVNKLSTDGNYTDVTLSLSSGATVKTQTFTVLQAAGWTYLPMQTQTFGAGDTSALSLKVSWGAASASGQLTMFAPYVYDVTGKTDVLYPPVVLSSVGTTATLNAGTLTVNSASPGILDPLTRRTQVSIVQGALSMTVVPTFGAASQPAAILFDVAQNASANRLVVYIASGKLSVLRVDNSGAGVSIAQLTLVTTTDATASQVTWKRDTAIAIRVRWDGLGMIYLSAGNGSATSTLPGSFTASDAAVLSISIGNDYTGASQFDGEIMDISCTVVGQPAS